MNIQDAKLILSSLKLNDSRFYYKTNKFEMWIKPIIDNEFDYNNKLLSECEKFDIYLYDLIENKCRYIDMRNDFRFNNYKPIMYNYFDGFTTIVNFGNGDSMPLEQLYELIIYINKLSNLIAFV